ncbi:MAG: hypothetical protein PV344_06950, partial [Anaplasma sp.]|nr:hypothetical protein [Anaplasma sp.]
PRKRYSRGLVSRVSGSQPKGRGFESRLKFFKFSLRQMNYRRPLMHITCHLLTTLIPRVTSCFT